MRKSIVFIVAAVIAVIGVYVARYLDTPVETKLARMIEYEESFTADAYFVRNESVYQAGASGTFYTFAQEGARVGKDRLIATVYNGIVDSYALQELSNLDKKIEELEDMNKNDIFVADASDSENRLKNLKAQIIMAREKNNPNAVVKIKSNIKSIVSGEVTENPTVEINALKEQKRQIESGLGNSKVDIYSGTAGVFSTNIDGLENVFTVDKIKEYRVEDFDTADEKITRNAGKNAALEGESVCKVIDNHVWYVMIKAEKSKCENYKKGQTVTMRFDSIPGIEAQAEIISISEEEGDYAVMMLECEKYIEGIFSIRQSSVEIIAKQYRGFEIPIYAVRVKDGKQGVMVQYGINEVFKPCEVIYTDKENDTVIINPITEGVTNPLEQYDRIVIGEKAEEIEGSEKE